VKLRNVFLGLIVVLTATVIPATPAMADPLPEVQAAVAGVVDLPVGTPVIKFDFGWG
jgi:hypothetical protein